MIGGLAMKRKIYDQLVSWKQDGAGRTALLIDGARRVGKSYVAEEFAKAEYKSYLLIDFNRVGDEVKDLFLHYLNDLDTLFMYLSGYYNVKLYEHESLIIFDEVQMFPRARAAIKYLVADGRYDYLETGSLMSIRKNVKDIVIPSEERHIKMYPMDFEEFLWAVGYTDSQISDMYAYMSAVKPLPKVLYEVIRAHFFDYMLVGGMPAIVRQFVVNNNFSGVAQMQQQLLYDYEEDITKYAQGLDKGKIKNIYNHIPVFLGRDNKKFQITKVAHGARSRDYVGTVEWLKDAGIVNVCYCLDQVSLPLKGNYNPRLFKLYYHDTGMLVASLDAESQDDLRQNRNYGTYKGGLFENIVSEMLVKQGYQLYFYRNDKSTVEMDFFVRTASSLVPVEVKASDNSTPSLNNLTGKPDKYPDIKFGIKLCDKNIGFNGKFYTFPYFLTFMLRRFLKERK